MTFRRRLVFFLFVFSLVPIAIMQVYTFVFYVPSISNKIKVLIDYSLQQKKENIRLMLRDNVDIIYQIAGDPSIAETIRSLSGSEAGIEALQESRLIEVFSQLCIFHSSLAGIGYIRNDGRLVEYDKYLMARDATSFDRLFPLRRIMETVDEQGDCDSFPRRYSATMPAYPRISSSWPSLLWTWRSELKRAISSSSSRKNPARHPQSARVRRDGHPHPLNPLRRRGTPIQRPRGPFLR